MTPAEKERAAVTQFYRDGVTHYSRAGLAWQGSDGGLFVHGAHPTRDPRQWISP